MENFNDLSLLSQRFREINKYITEQANPNPNDPNAQQQAPAGGEGDLPPLPSSMEGQGGMGNQQSSVGQMDQDLSQGNMGQEGGQDMGQMPMGDTSEVDPENDPDVEVVDSEGEPMGSSEDGMPEDSEVLDITDLVTTQKSIETKQSEMFNYLSSQTNKMEELVTQLNSIYDKVANLEDKFDKYRPKTAKEKLELRSLDSGPFTQKLSDFFDDKEDELEASGKNEYVLTSDEIDNYSDSEIESSFISPQQKQYSEFVKSIR